MADKLTPATLPDYLLWYGRVQRQIAWFLAETMLTRVQEGAPREEVLGWLCARPFGLEIPPEIVQMAREYFHSASEDARRYPEEKQAGEHVL
jgi:hypothetical protein